MMECSHCLEPLGSGEGRCPTCGAAVCRDIEPQAHASAPSPSAVVRKEPIATEARGCAVKDIKSVTDAAADCGDEDSSGDPPDDPPNDPPDCGDPPDRADPPKRSHFADLPPDADPITFVGRATELESLRQALAEPYRDRPRVVVIEGEQGIGKTRLFNEAWRRLERPPTLLNLEAQAHDRPLAYAPLLRWLVERVGLAPGALPHVAASRIEAFAATTSGLEQSDVIWIEALLGVPAALRRLQSMPEPEFRSNLTRLLTALLAPRRPATATCLLIDQAQWLDPAMRQLLDNFLTLKPALPLTVVFILRGGEGAQLSLRPDLRLQLGPLAPDERARLFDALTPALDFLPELRRKVIEHVGTPLFLRELTRLVRQVQKVNAGPVGPAQVIKFLPRGVESIVARRVELLDDRARRVLEVASLLGDDAALGLMECFSQIREDLREQLMILEGLELLERRRRRNTIHCTFLEGMVRETAYSLMTDSQRRRLHAQAAEALEREPEAATPQRLAQIAEHWSHAGERAIAAPCWIRSADRQMRWGDPDVAVELYDTAIEALQDSAPTPLNRTRMARALVQRAVLARRAGDAQLALEMLEMAESIAASLSNEWLLLQARLERALTRAEDPAEDTEALLEPVIAEAGRLGHGLAATVAVNALALAQWRAGRLDSAMERFGRAAAQSRSLDADHLEADALNNIGLIYWRWGRYREAGTYFRGAAGIRMRIGDRHGLIAPLANLGIQQEQLGEIRPARGSYRQALELAQATGDLRAQATLLVNLSNLARRAHLAAEALESAGQALDLARRAHWPNAELVALQNLGLAHAAAGRQGHGLDLLGQALEMAWRIGAPELTAQVELDLLALRLKAGVAPFDLTVSSARRLLALADSNGWQDLLIPSHRVLGLALLSGDTPQAVDGVTHLDRSLMLAERQQNIFEERETLAALSSASAVDPPRREKLTLRLARINDLLDNGLEVDMARERQS